MERTYGRQLLDMHGPMFLGASTSFAQPDALKGSLVKTLRDVKPTVFFGVPRVSGHQHRMNEKQQQHESIHFFGGILVWRASSLGSRSKHVTVWRMVDVMSCLF